MTAIVMNVDEVVKHPNADTLMVYQMSAMNSGELVKSQIIANLENVYEIGDNVVVVLAGSVLKGGEKIRYAKIRGVASHGMALGKTDLPMNTDVTLLHCESATDVVAGFSMIKWPSIESLFNVRRGLKKAQAEKKVIYIGKVKLDGTNAAVQVSTDGRIVAQSRSILIILLNDATHFFMLSNIIFYHPL